MDACFGWLCILPIVLGAVALVGHGLWLLFVAVGRLLFGADEPPAVPPVQEACPRCGRPLRPEQRRCPACNLHRAGTVAVELRDLEATARQAQRFLDTGALDPEAGERLYRCIEARQRLLIEGKPAAAPVAPVPEDKVLDVLPVEPAAVPPIERPNALPGPQPSGGGEKDLVPAPAAAAPAPSRQSLR